MNGKAQKSNEAKFDFENSRKLHIFKKPKQEVQAGDKIEI